MSIRTFRATDLPRFLLNGSKLGPNWAQTWDKIGTYSNSSSRLSSGAINLVFRRERMLSSVIIEGGRLKAIASVRSRSGSKVWEVHFLNLSTELEEGGVELLERLCAIAGNQGSQKVIIRLPAMCDAVELAKHAGFLHCVQETLYIREPSYTSDALTAKFIRPFLSGDEYPVFRLYNECVPSKVKSTYAMTFDEWSDSMESFGGMVQEGVYEDRGSIRGWIRVCYANSAPNLVEIMVHPEEETCVSEDLLSWGLKQGRPTVPFQCLIPDYRSNLALVLGKKGFIPTGEYCLMVKPIAIRVRDASLAAVGA